MSSSRRSRQRASEEVQGVDLWQKLEEFKLAAETPTKAKAAANKAEPEEAKAGDSEAKDGEEAKDGNEENVDQTNDDNKPEIEETVDVVPDKPVLTFSSGETNERFVLVVGPKQSGKTTFITGFLNPTKDENPKPTVALDYQYGRRPNASGNGKDIAHIFELGGGDKLTELISVVMSSERIENMVITITVDLLFPSEAISSCMKWVEVVNAHTRSCLKEMKGTSKQAISDRILKAADKRMSKCSDKSMLSPCILPLVIVGTKYDKFRDEDSVKRKLVIQALRYLAHGLGASLVTVGRKEKLSSNYLRVMFNHYAFGADPKKTPMVDVTKPIMVLAGRDSMESIGAPLGATREDFADTSIQLLDSSRIKKWNKALNEYYPASSHEAEDEGKEADKDKLVLTPEAAVDSMRAQKDLELEQYKENVRRAQMGIRKKKISK